MATSPIRSSEMVPDVLAVMDAAGMERAALVGWVDAAAGRGAPSRGEVRGLEMNTAGDDFLIVFESPTIRDMVIGSTFQFTPRGRHELKGVPGSWEIFGVAS